MPQTAEQPKPSPDFKGTDLGDEFLFYDVERDQVHVLNGTAREIFLLCDGSRTTDEIAQAFAKLHDDADTAREDAVETVRRLLELGLLS